MSNGKKNGKTAKKRRRYGSFAWTDKKTGYLYSRIRIKQTDGTTKTILKRAMNVTHAEQLADEARAEHEARGQAYLDGRTMTFEEFADWYKKEFVIAPVYSGDVKVEGMRTWRQERNKIDRIVADVGKTLLMNEIDEDVLRRFKRKRLRDVGIATVNRDLETLQAMMRRARKKKWRRDDIDFSELLDKSLERRRTMTVTAAQVEALIDASRGWNYSPRMHALILTLYDGGARPSEIYPVQDFDSNYSDGSITKYYPLRWRDLFDENGEIVDITVVTSTKGRRIEQRLMVVTNRMAEAFRSLWTFLQQSKNVTPEHAASLDNLVFPHRSFKRAWEIVRVKAGLPELRLRDLRRDWVTRTKKRGFSDMLGQRAAGHKRMQTNFEYTEFDLEAALQLKTLLDREVIETDSVQ